MCLRDHVFYIVTNNQKNRNAEWILLLLFNDNKWYFLPLRVNRKIHLNSYDYFVQINDSTNWYWVRAVVICWMHGKTRL